MDYFSIDYFIVFSFLILTLIIGLRAGRGIKDIREYALTNKIYGVGALVLTWLATNMSGASIINMAGLVFSDGIIVTIALLGLISSYFIIVAFCYRKIVYFKDCLTMGDVMAKLYGNNSALIASGLSFCSAICIVGMELSMLGVVCESLLGLKATWGIIIGGTLLMIYTALGGMSAVTATDIFQFFVLIVIVPIIAGLALKEVGGISELFAKVPSSKLVVFHHEEFSSYLALFIMWSVLPAGVIDVALIPRLLMAKTESKVWKQFLFIAAFDPMFQLAVMLIGLAGVVLYPTLEPNDVVSHIICTLLPAGVKGVAISGMLAVVMSTIDSYLHATGLTFAHDILRPLCARNGMAVNELAWARYSTFFIGAIAIVVALSANDILGLWITALEFTEPILMVPFIAGVMGLRSSKQSFFTAMFVSLAVFLFCKQFLPETLSHFTVLFSILANGVTFLGMHVIQNRGFVTVRYDERKIT